MLLYEVVVENECLNPLCFTTVPNYHSDLKINENQMLCN